MVQQTELFRRHRGLQGTLKTFRQQSCDTSITFLLTIYILFYSFYELFDMNYF